MISDWKNPRFDKIWRLCAIFILCGLIYYFSFDNGRQTAKAKLGRYETQISRLQAEIDSLHVQLKLQSQEISALRGASGDIPPASPTPSPAEPSADGELSPGHLAIGEAGAAPRSPDLSIPQNQLADSAEGSSSILHLSLRQGESRLILNDQARVSVLEIDSLDKVAQVRVQHLDSDIRNTRTLEVGDSLFIQRGEERHILLLDQLKGSLASFILISS